MIDGFTKAEISDDGTVVHLVHALNGKPEHYYVSYWGAGVLNSINHYEIHGTTSRFDVPKPA